MDPTHQGWAFLKGSGFLQVWQDALCRAAFPSQYSTVVIQEKNRRLSITSASPLNSPAKEDNPYDTPWDSCPYRKYSTMKKQCLIKNLDKCKLQQVRVMLISTESSRRLGIGEGTYDLSFGSEALLLKSDDGIVEAWDYKLITWFGYGENCCCFETENNQCFEFKCSKPDNIYERLRSQIRLKPDPDPRHRPLGVVQSYYASYVPLLKNGVISPSRPRTIFAPRASIDTAIPTGIYALSEANSPSSPASFTENKTNEKQITKMAIRRTKTSFGNSPPVSPQQDFRSDASCNTSIITSIKEEEEGEESFTKRRFLPKFLSFRKGKNKAKKVTSSPDDDTEWTYQAPAATKFNGTRNGQSNAPLASPDRDAQSMQDGIRAVSILKPHPPPRMSSTQALVVQELGQRFSYNSSQYGAFKASAPYEGVARMRDSIASEPPAEPTPYPSQPSLQPHPVFRQPSLKASVNPMPTARLSRAQVSDTVVNNYAKQYGNEVPRNGEKNATEESADRRSAVSTDV